MRNASRESAFDLFSLLLQRPDKTESRRPTARLPAPTPGSGPTPTADLTF